MRRWYIYIVLYAIVGVFGLSPFRGNDIATLSPVEVVWVEGQPGSIRMETDSGEVGIGATVEDALDGMKATAATKVFLDTADYIIVKKGCEDILSELTDILRPSCAVCVAERMPDLEKAAEFLTVHEPSVKMKTLCKSELLPALQEEKGRMVLIEEGDTDSAADCLADRRGQRTDPESGAQKRLADSCG